MYRLSSIFTQEPTAVKAAVLAILVALVTTDVVNLTGDQIAAWGLALELVLGLLYVRPLSVSKSGLAEVQAAKPKRPAKKG